MASCNRIVIVPSSIDSAFGQCIDAIAKITGSRIQRTDPIGGIIVARTKMNWQTFGDEIKCVLRAVDSDLTEVEINCMTIRHQIIDWGRNAGHVQVICEHLKIELDLLLRPSTNPVEPETNLLRPAQHHPEVDPSQLLRPVDENEPAQ